MSLRFKKKRREGLPGDGDDSMPSKIADSDNSLASSPTTPKLATRKSWIGNLTTRLRSFSSPKKRQTDDQDKSVSSQPEILSGSREFPINSESYAPTSLSGTSDTQKIPIVESQHDPLLQSPVTQSIERDVPVVAELSTEEPVIATTGGTVSERSEEALPSETTGVVVGSSVPSVAELSVHTPTAEPAATEPPADEPFPKDNIGNATQPETASRSDQPAIMSTETPAEQILTPEAVDDSSFDVVETYRNLLAMDPDLTMPVAAIESLVLGLAAHPTTTISETLDLLRDLSQRLAESTPNPISLSAGTDLFQRYLIMSLRPGNVPLASKKGTKKLPATDDFTTIRAHLLKHGRSFVANAKAARARIASFGRNLMKEGCTVLTTGGSRVVAALLREAAEGGVRFRVVYVLPPPRPGRPQSEGLDLVKDLRERGVPVATVSEGAVGYSLAGGVGGGKVDMVIVGAEGVVENGGIISRLGTCQIGMLAKAAHRPFYVVAESHKFVRMFPLSQGDLGIEQRIVDFRTDEPNPWDMTPDPVDFTSPEYISGIITEAGILTPSAVSEELIKIWF